MNNVRIEKTLLLGSLDHCTGALLSRLRCRGSLVGVHRWEALGVIEQANRLCV